MVRQGHEVLLFTLEDNPQELPIEVRVITIDHLCFPVYPDKKIARPTLRSLLRVFNALSQFRPQVVHAVADALSNTFLFCGYLLGIPVVGSFHTDIVALLRSGDAYGFQKFCIVLKEAIDSVSFDSCATTSKSFQRKLRGQYVHCDHVIITSVNNVMFSPKKRNQQIRRKLMFGDDGGFLCVYVGRISNEKKLEVMVAIIHDLNSRNGYSRKVYLAIIGDGPTATKYSHLHGPANRVYCKPKFYDHPELSQIYASSDVHVSASEFETLGNTVLEAFASGLPVVVPRTQGFSDTVHHEVDGFLFSPGDMADAKQYLMRLIEDQALLDEMGAAAIRAVNELTVENVVKDLLQWYRLGMKRRTEKSLLIFALSTIFLAFVIQVTVAIMGAYDLIVNVLPRSTKRKKGPAAGAAGDELDGKSILRNDSMLFSLSSGAE